jgi:hypothetical protein
VPVYGDVSQPLLDLLKAHAVGFKWFTFFEGLERSDCSPTSDARACRPERPERGGRARAATDL